jgi:hypothetical protein
MGARKVWQMFPSVILSHDFTSTLFSSSSTSIPSKRVRENVLFLLFSLTTLHSAVDV